MIRLAAVSVLALFFLVPRVRAEFSAADWEFLRQQCQMFKEELEFFPKLAPDTQAQVTAWVAARDSRALVPFRDTRHYYYLLTRLRPGAPLPFSRPPAGWNESYLLPAELAQYKEILTGHPPCKEIWPDPPVDRLTAGQKEILRSQCNILPEDIEVIRLLSTQTQDNILRWLAANDLPKLVAFRNSREYYRKMLVKVGLVPMPPAFWKPAYLTPEEYCNYTSMLDYAPW